MDLVGEVEKMSFFDRYLYTHGQKAFNYLHNVCLAPIGLESSLMKEKLQFFKSPFVAHRGLRSHPEFKENTLAAFEKAWEYTPHIEFDLRMTQDKVIVINHDSDLQAMWGHPGQIREMSISKVKSISSDILTLSELLSSWESFMYELFPRITRSQFKPWWFIEIKREDDMAHVDLLLDQLQVAWQQVNDVCVPVLIGLDAEVMRKIRQRFPEAHRSYVSMIQTTSAVEYIQEDPQCGLLGWYFNYPKHRGFSEGQNGVGFLNHTRAMRIYYQRNTKSDRPIWLFTDRVDRLGKY